MRASRGSQVVVLGAGPYGLSVAAHLAARGTPFRIFGRAMSSWRFNMPSGMYLKSPGRASNLSDPAGEHTLERFCKSANCSYSDWERPISGELFARYGMWFQQNLVPDLDPREVLLCDRTAEGYLLQVEGGETIHAASVVVSSGHVTSAHLPDALVDLPPDLVTHSSAHASFERFRNKDVVVLGAGQSALESAALLREAGARPTLVARCGSLVWGGPEKANRSLVERCLRPKTSLSFGWRYVFYEHPWLPFHGLPARLRRKHVDTVLGPLGAWWLRDRVVDRMPILLDWRLQHARPTQSGVMLRLRQNDQTQELLADHVIAATGYRVRPSSFPFLSNRVRAAIRWRYGAPDLSSAFESSVPGLHFTGLAAAYSFGPVMRFVAGAHPTAARIGAHLAGRHAPSERRSFAFRPSPQQAA